MNSLHPETGTSKVAKCNFCMKVLGKQYHYTCHICGATYCYIHMTKHARAHKATMQVALAMGR